MKSEDVFTATDDELREELRRMACDDVVTYRAIMVARELGWADERLHLVLAVAQGKQAKRAMDLFVERLMCEPPPLVIVAPREDA